MADTRLLSLVEPRAPARRWQLCFGKPDA